MSSYDGVVSKMLRVYVRRVIDGDTILVDIENPSQGLMQQERVRLLGIDTPEMAAPNRPQQRFGREASTLTKEALEKKYIYLAFDWELRDRYGRLLAYVYFENGGCFNAMMIRQGYVRAYNRYAFHFFEEFQTYEREARTKRLGLWAGGGR
jgi:micrococcal nuclease